MKIITILIVLLLVGCATSKSIPSCPDCWSPKCPTYSHKPILKSLDSNSGWSSDNQSIVLRNFKEVTEYSKRLEERVKCYEDSLSLTDRYKEPSNKKVDDCYVKDDFNCCEFSGCGFIGIRGASEMARRCNEWQRKCLKR